MLSRKLSLSIVAYSFWASSHAFAVTTSWNTNANGNFTTAANGTAACRTATTRPCSTADSSPTKSISRAARSSIRRRITQSTISACVRTRLVSFILSALQIGPQPLGHQSWRFDCRRRKRRRRRDPEHVCFLENTTAVKTVTATDIDLPPQTITFSIVGGADQARFGITPGGALSFLAAPNYEAPTDANGDNVYVVTVQASDGAGGTATQTISVTVTPVNDNNPVITSPDSVNVPENTTAVLTVTATDADLPPQAITFSIIGGADQARFAITPSGVLSFNSAPNFEAPTDSNGDNVYVVIVAGQRRQPDRHPGHPGHRHQRARTAARRLQPERRRRRGGQHRVAEHAGQRRRAVLRRRRQRQRHD